ncbi:MAG: hypothetical protein FWE37_08800 [Spirochaetaceae bacterium]|nr:hypothetical protein [Spirochaetaceae bacterium]
MKKVTVFLLLLLITSGLQAQTAQTASDFLNRVSERYATINDYTANITIRWPNRVETGQLLFRAPNNLRINYTSPPNQTLVINNNLLQLHLPRFGAIMEQRLGASDVALGGLMTGAGLRILQENYSVSWINTPNLQPLVPGSSIMVHKLRLEWRTFSEGFRTIDLSITPNLLIVRVEATTSLFERIIFEYSNINLNTGLAASLFVLELPETDKPTTFTNFLFPTN